MSRSRRRRRGPSQNPAASGASPAASAASGAPASGSTPATPAQQPESKPSPSSPSPSSSKPSAKAVDRPGKPKPKQKPKVKPSGKSPARASGKPAGKAPGKAPGKPSGAKPADRAGDRSSDRPRKPCARRRPRPCDRYDYELRRTVFLIGYMGAGKSSLGKMLSRLCDVPFVDLDRKIAQAQGMRSGDIIRTRGEEAFRAIEHEALVEVAGGEPVIVACGGGIVMDPANLDVLAKRGLCVYLEVTPQEARERISDITTRPLLEDDARAQELWQLRRPIYRDLADVTYHPTRKPLPALVHDVRTMLEKRGILWKTPKS